MALLVQTAQEKGTVMKMILSLIQPDAGEVQLLGEKSYQSQL